MNTKQEESGNWRDHQIGLVQFTQRQLFFVGGAPRSGTTWLQYLLDSHPDISCRGEGHFMKCLAEPIERAMLERRRDIGLKNAAIFGRSQGYPLSESEDTEFLIATAIAIALQRQCEGVAYRAVGEKTPDNVFFFDRLKRLFPTAKLICIARDPRDLLSSAWHFFHKQNASADEPAAKRSYLQSAIPPVQAGTRVMLELAERYNTDCMIITYERLIAATANVAGRLFKFLGVSDNDDIVQQCIARTSFDALSGGRVAGVTQEGSFFRRGVVGDWTSTFTPEMNEMILQELGWMFPIFGWKP